MSWSPHFDKYPKAVPIWFRLVGMCVFATVDRTGFYVPWHL